jgi:hypothetical protein
MGVLIGVISFRTYRRQAIVSSRSVSRLFIDFREESSERVRYHLELGRRFIIEI